MLIDERKNVIEAILRKEVRGQYLVEVDHYMLRCDAAFGEQFVKAREQEVLDAGKDWRKLWVIPGADLLRLVCYLLSRQCHRGHRIWSTVCLTNEANNKDRHR